MENMQAILDNLLVAKNALVEAEKAHGQMVDMYGEGDYVPPFQSAGNAISRYESWLEGVLFEKQHAV